MTRHRGAGRKRPRSGGCPLPVQRGPRVFTPLADGGQRGGRFAAFAGVLVDTVAAGLFRGKQCGVGTFDQRTGVVRSLGLSQAQANRESQFFATDRQMRAKGMVEVVL